MRILYLVVVTLTIAPPARAAAVALTGSVELLCARNADPTIRYAVDRTRYELETVFARTVIQSHLDESRLGGLTLVLADKTHLAEISALARKRGLSLHEPASASGAFAITAGGDPPCVLIMGHDPIGAWYGACAWLDRLHEAENGSVQFDMDPVRQAPAFPLRFTRDCIPGGSLENPDQARISMDWWARWRMNATRVGQMPEPRMRTVLEQSHLRGIQVFLGLGVRNLCAADEQQVRECVNSLDAFLRLGGDGAAVYWDDLAHSRCAGHCDKCREKFGANSLPHEIASILEALIDVAERYPGRRVTWCPSHYSSKRYPEMSDEDFFAAIASHPRILQHTAMFYCEFSPAKLAFLDRAGIRNRIWWNNGMRSLYPICARFAPKELSLSIPGIKGFKQPGFPHFDWGWLMGIGAKPDGAMVMPSVKTLQEMRSVGERFSGYYPCTDVHPYHTAISGLFAWNPESFEQEPAERLVFRRLIGPDTAKPARQWAEQYEDLQLRLARASGGTSKPSTSAGLSLDRWRHTREAVATRSRKTALVLSRELREQVLDRMQKAEEEFSTAANSLR